MDTESDMEKVAAHTAEDVIKASGMQKNTRVILFDGLDVDVFHPCPEAFSSHRMAVSLYNIQRWNGHLRIPAALNLREGRSLDDGAGTPYVFYSDLSHSMLVAYCLQRTTPQNDTSRRRLVRQSLLHEASEILIGDMVGPFKRQIKEHVRPFERNIDAKAFDSLNISVGMERPLTPLEIGLPDYDEAALIKRADIMAQDIEATIGQCRHLPGVNVSVGFRMESWMLPALVYCLNATPEDFIRALQDGDVLANTPLSVLHSFHGKWFKDFAEDAGIVYHPDETPMWTLWSIAFQKASPALRETMFTYAKRV